MNLICYICRQPADHIVYTPNDDRATCLVHTIMATKLGFEVECQHR